MVSVQFAKLEICNKVWQSSVFHNISLIIIYAACDYILLNEIPSSYLPLITTPPVRYNVQINKAATSITLLLIFDRALKYFMINKSKRKKWPSLFLLVFYYLTFFIYWIRSCKKPSVNLIVQRNIYKIRISVEFRKRKRQHKVSLVKCKEFSIWLFLLY